LSELVVFVDAMYVLFYLPLCARVRVQNPVFNNFARTHAEPEVSQTMMLVVALNGFAKREGRRRRMRKWAWGVFVIGV
jgi:hypothetical protein